MEEGQTRLATALLGGFIVASVGPIQVGIEIVEPNWPLMCVALTSHAMRALGYLEADRPDLALAALKDARAVGDLAMMVRCDIPKMDSHASGDTVAIEANVQRMADMLAQLHAIAAKWEAGADRLLEECGGPRGGHPEYSTRLAIWARLEDLKVALSTAANASQRARRAVMDGKRDAIR